MMTPTCSNGGTRPRTRPLKNPRPRMRISPEQEYFDNGILMVAMIKAGVELAFDTMVSAGIIAESADY